MRIEKKRPGKSKKETRVDLAKSKWARKINETIPAKKAQNFRAGCRLKNFTLTLPDRFSMAMQNTKNKVEKVIMGVDPGTQVMGFGIIRVTGKETSLVLMDTLILNKYDSHPLRLKKIFDRSISLIEKYLPDEIALEAPFYGKNVQSMLKLGRAQGVVMAAALSRDIPVVEYSPKKVKMALTGNGNASKEQVAGMIKTLLKINILPDKLDATDAAAVAMCHYLNGFGDMPQKKYSGWKSFIKDNPGKIG